MLCNISLLVCYSVKVMLKNKSHFGSVLRYMHWANLYSASVLGNSKLSTLNLKVTVFKYKSSSSKF